MNELILASFSMIDHFLFLDSERVMTFCSFRLRKGCFLVGILRASISLQLFKSSRGKDRGIFVIGPFNTALFLTNQDDQKLTIQLVPQ